MEHDVGLGFRQGARELCAVAHVALDVAHLSGEPEKLEMAFVVGRRQGVAGDIGAELEQPGRQPRALEAGMAGHEDLLAVVEVAEHGCLDLLLVYFLAANAGARSVVSSRQGASFASHILLRSWTSFFMSMHFQKPW